MLSKPSKPNNSSHTTYSIKKKIGLAGIVLLIFVGFLQYESYKQTHFKVNKVTFSKVDSLNNFIQLEAKRVNGLVLADHYHLMSPENHVIHVMNLQRDIRIEKVWLTEGRIYLIYSMNIKKSDQGIEDLPKLTIKKVSIDIKGGKEVDANLLPTERVVTDGHAIGHRVYRGLYFNMQDMDRSMPSLYKEILPHANDITFKKVALELTQNNDYTTVSLQNFKVPVTFGSSIKPLYTQSINKTLTLQPGLKLNMKQVKLYVYGTVIDYDVNNNKDISIAKIQMNGYSADNTYENQNVTLIPSNHAVIFQPITHFPFTIQFNPISYIYQSNDSIDLSMTKQKIAKVMAKAPQDILIGNQHSVKVSVSMPTGKVNPNGQFKFDLKMALPKSKTSSLYLRDFISLIKPSLTDKNSSSHNNSAFHIVNNRTTVRIMKGDGKDFLTTHMTNMQSRSNEVTMSFVIDKSELLKAKHMRFLISPLLHSADFKETTPFKITINDTAKQ